MGMLFDLLPLLDGWEYRLLDVDDETLLAGETYDVIFEERELGWILSSALTLIGENAEKTRISVRVDDWVLDTTIERLQQAGLVQRGVMTPYIARYDTVLNIYQAVFEFAYPLPYKSFLRVSVTGPTQNAIRFSGEAATIRIRRESGMREKFIASLQKVLGTTGIVKEIAEVAKRVKPGGT